MNKNTEEKEASSRGPNTLLTIIVTSIVRGLILLGYVIMHPFEMLFGYGVRLFNYLKGYDYKKRRLQLKRKIAKYKKKKLEKRKRVKKKKVRKKTAKKKLKQEKKTKKIKGKPTFWDTSRLFLLGVFFTLVFVLVPLEVRSWYKELPDTALLESQTQNQTTKILDRDGRLLYEIYVDKKYNPVSLKDIPDSVINATLAIEDSEFYSHSGIRPYSMLRAAKSTVVDEELQGASTITQQLIKNILLTPERTVSRKIKEIVLAFEVERAYSKNEILELYLNNIPYGGTAYGIQAASQQYFGKDVGELSLAEASMLAGLPSAPSVYSPVQGNLELSKQRQAQVLNRMVELKYITQEEADASYQEELVFAPQVAYIRAPHFVTYVRNELYSKYGQRYVDFGGLTVTTTLDLELQDKVQEIVFEEVSKAEQQNLGFSNGAAVVLDSQTGEILAYVGSVDYFGEDEGKFDVVTAYRQPGSSIKPITYALALENGYTAATLIDDSKITYQSYGQTYTPRNYDNRFHGKVTLRTALANSYNIPAVKLVNALGVDNMVQLGKDMGLDNWVVADGSYGLAVTLGGKEVRLLDLANVYATFARQGVYRETTPFVSITDVYGFEVNNINGNSEKEVLKPETSYLISHILSDNSARTPTFGARSQLVIPGQTVAVKTGTTNDIRDNLTVGYTPTYTVGVWVGNNDNTPMNPRLASGLSGASTIWNSVFTEILKDSEKEAFERPAGIFVKQDSECNNAVEVFDKNSRIPKNLCDVSDKDKDKDKDKEKDD